MPSNIRVLTRTFLLVTVGAFVAVSVAGAANINGSIWSDHLVGTGSDDRIDGGLGNDEIEGRAGNDVLIGSFGNDELHGEVGADVLDGGFDQDDIHGGDGNDVASGGPGSDVFDGGAGHDVWDGDTGTNAGSGGAGLDVLRADIGIQTSNGGADNDVLVSLTGTSLHTQNGDDGNDVIAGWGVVRGGAGDDVLTNNGGTLIDGGPGNDVCRRAALTPTVNCEAIVTIGVNLFAPSLTVTSAPAENAQLTSGTISIAFAASNAAATYCMVDSGAISPCSGSYSATGLSTGEHALAVIAVSSGAQPAKVFLRHFSVDAPTPPAEPASVTSVASPEAEVLRLETQTLANVASVRAVFADGGSAVWLATDPKVTISTIGTGVRVDVRDPNLAAERVVVLELRRANTSVITSWSGDVSIASSVALQEAASPAASTLRIAGEHLERVDSIQLVHSGGSLVIAMTEPGVVRTAGLITITSRALDGLTVTQIDAIRALDGQEIVSSIEVDIEIAATDDVAPVISVPTPDPIEAVASTGASVAYEASAVDAVDGPVAVTCTPASGMTFPIGTTDVQCAAEDAAGNDAAASFDVRIVDTTGPALTLPTAMALDATSRDGAVVEYSPTAVDLVDGDINVVCSPASGTTLPVGVTVVTCAAVDSRGNESTGTFDVTVRDVTAPELERVDPQDSYEVASPTGGIVEFAVTSHDDIDGDIAVVCNPASGSSFAVGTHPVHCEAVDAAGNVGELDFSIDVVHVDAHESAANVIEDSFPDILEEGYTPNLPMGVVRSVPSTDTVVMDVADENGQLKRIYGYGDFGFTQADGTVVSYDTSLVSNSTGFTPTRVPYSVVLPHSYRDGISWGLQRGSERALVAAVGTRMAAADGEVTPGGDQVIYPGVWNAIDAIVTAEARGVKEHFIARSASAPRDLVWTVTVPAGAELRVEEQRVLLEHADGELTILSDRPMARDAAGRLIPVRYVVESTAGVWRLTLSWSVLGADVPSGEAVTWPVDIDPAYEIPSTHPPATGFAQQSATPENNGLEVACTNVEWRIDFIGRTYPFGDAPDVDRTFSPSAYGSCRIPGPPEGSEWYSFDAGFEWAFTSHHMVNLRDETDFGPKDDQNHYLTDFTTTTSTSGGSGVHWGGPSSTGGQPAPEGEVRFEMTTRSASAVPGDKIRRGKLERITRLFYDDSEPETVSVVPSDDATLVKPGTYPVYFSTLENGSGCTTGLFRVLRDGMLIHEQAFAGCEFASSISLGTPGAYDFEFVVRDLAGNVNEESGSLVVVDPIVSPEAADPAPLVSATTSIEVEVATNYDFGAFELEAVNADGVVAPVGVPIGGGGEATVSWDTTHVQNGPYTLRAVLANGTGRHLLDAVNVVVQNVRPMSVAAPSSASTTDVGAGFQALHRTGALAGSFQDVSQQGAGGIPFGFERSYHSQNTKVGFLGVGWSTSFEQRLVRGDDQVMSFIDATGREWAFKPRAGGGFDPVLGFEGQLRVNPNVLTAAERPWEIVFPDGRSLFFNAAMQLIRETWLSGAYITYGTLQPSGGEYTITIADSAGHTIVGSVTADGRLYKVTDSTNHSWYYAFDASRNLAHVTDPTLAVTDLVADTSGVITRVEDPLNRATTFAFAETSTDADETISQLNVITDPATTPRTLEYDGVGAGDVYETFAGRETVSTLDDKGQLQEFANAEGDTIAYEYNARGQVTSFEDENGDVTATTYNAQGCKTSEVDAEENVIAYSAFDPGCRAKTVTEPTPIDSEDPPLTTTYEFDGYGRQIARTTPDSQTTSWSYQPGSELPSSMNPPAGATIEYVRDSTGNVLDEKYEDAEGDVHHVTRATYDAAGRMLTQRQGDLPATVFGLDGLGRVEKESNPLGYTETQFNAAGEVESTRDKNGGITEYEYDLRGNQKLVDPPGPEFTEMVFSPHGDMETSKDALGHVTEYTYDNAGNIETETDPEERTTSYGYDGVGNETANRLPGDLTSTLTEYDGNGNERLITNPDLSTSETTYTPRGGIHTERDALTHLTTYGYDAVGRQKTITNAENETSETFYDAAGRVTAQEDAANRRTSYELDALGNVVKTTNADLTYSETEFDDAGRATRRVDERGEATVLSYDADGHVLSELRPDGGLWQYEYDGNGNRTYSRTPAGEVTRWTFDANNRVTTIEAPGGLVTTNTYDASGNLVQVEAPDGKSTEYEYDDANQRELMREPGGVETTYTYTPRGELDHEVRDGITTNYDYDLRGNLIKVTKAGRVTDYVYDAVGNLERHDMPDGTRIDYEYDKVGRLVRETHSLRGATEYTYDQSGQIVTMTTSAGTVEYTRDPRGHVTRIDFPDGKFATYSYDDAGYPTGVTDEYGARPITRDEAGRVKTFTTARGFPGSYSYDDAGRVTQMTYQLPRGQRTRTYTYDAAGRLKTLTGSHTGTTTYSYTTNGQLESKAFPGGRSITYTYDDKGRLKTQQLTTMPLRTYSYDDQDRVVLIEETISGVTQPLDRYAYNDAGQLASWWHDRDFVRNDYHYDAGGRIIKTTRRVTVAPTGTNTPAEDATLVQCRASPPTCPWPEVSQILFRAVPEFGDPRGFAGRGAAIARSMVRGDEYVIKTFGYNAKGQLAALRLSTWEAPETRFAHDARGNMTTYPGRAWSYTWDNKVATPAQKRTSDGLVLDTRTDSSSSMYTELDYDDQGRIIWAKRHYNNAAVDWEVEQDPWGINSLKLDGQQVAYQYYNHRGDLLGVHSPTFQTVFTAQRFDPYGEPQTGNITQYPQTHVNLYNPFQWGGRDQTIYSFGIYTGQWHTLLMGDRQYSPALYGFLQADPEAGRDGASDTAYGYVGYDPINHIDPDGRAAQRTIRSKENPKYYCKWKPNGPQGGWFVTARKKPGGAPLAYQFKVLWTCNSPMLFMSAGTCINSSHRRLYACDTTGHNAEDQDHTWRTLAAWTDEFSCNASRQWYQAEVSDFNAEGIVGDTIIEVKLDQNERLGLKRKLLCGRR